MIDHALSQHHPQVLDLIKSGIAEWGGNFMEDLAPWMERTCTLEHIEHIQERGCLFTALDAQTSHGNPLSLVGTANGHPNEEMPGTWVLGGIYVTRKNLGIGQELAHKVLEVGHSKGFQEAYSYVHEENTGSLRFLKRLGAVEIGDEVKAGNRYIILSTWLASYGVS